MATTTPKPPADLKIILLGDSAVGKSKLAERFLLNDFHPQVLSTYALTLYQYTCTFPFPQNPSPNTSQTMMPPTPRKITIDFWDTAGQERFQTMHPSYYHGAHACILVFDVGRKVTYKNLDTWYEELVALRGDQLPIIVIANKIDTDESRAKKSFGFIDRRRAERLASLSTSPTSSSPTSTPPTPESTLPLYFTSASSGTNVVAAFRDAITRAWAFKEGGGGGTFVDEVLAFIREGEGVDAGKSGAWGVAKGKAGMEVARDARAQ
ncbi:P-loop containing nucleoside triphosphate hydrolase protein [Fimicolochytrium jonesii]|uniref:P-loop containing nucleoside triphosphate hydrolase protein n=1 Tax=Fimicolochytrium jonesii TaxID=1396493 RepID=UPI0022FF1E78|nr:P-loop containing nucleoside triphosphate hydrolase protein [Fimicolochytrium jonesii]KAI8827251.1 P-loop containing nucleoside triphosphate hydrolase protein [Fimicolochytrium jonesii]